MADGFYSLPRGWMDHPVFGTAKRSPFSRRDAWVWLVENAAWKPTKVKFGGRDYDLQPGEQVRSLRHLVGVWGWDTMKVARFVSALHSAGHVTVSTDTAGTRISICNYGINGLGACITETGSSVSPRHSPSADRDGREQENNISPSEAKASSGDSCADAMVAIWIDLCGDIHKPILSRLGKDRVGKLKARFKDAFNSDIEAWRAYCEQVQRSPMLNGTKTDWHATLDWVLEPRNLRKVLEGVYDDRKPALSLVVGGAAESDEPLPEDVKWRARLDWSRKREGRWLTSEWGPPPTDPDCDAPHDLLVEFGHRQHEGVG